MKIDSFIKAGGIEVFAFAQTLAKVGAIVDVMAAAAPDLARPKWRMQGDTLDEAQAGEVYAADGQPSSAAVTALENEYRGEETSSIGIWDGSADDSIGASVEVFACGGHFPDTVSIGARGAFIDNKDVVASIVIKTAQEFSPVVISAAPEGYPEKQAFQDRPGVGWMIYLPVDLTTQQIPEAQEIVPVLSADRKRRLGTILVSIKDEVFSADNDEHLTVAHNIEARLISMDLLPLLADI
ncbi:Imm52 family immunity protein [Burkholderia sp. B21-007]|uniref:Imm52 family immunity protein n=1 Tax=Burkholderia sp. B21-007 TaxID=2890407 RepID=UPI001E5AB07F|nr:Imm52 family immunity protein [Burkholderia sp. B21-007]UEP27021.1 immunity 52 family protein [Burkholderia sp. B21-007]